MFLKVKWCRHIVFWYLYCTSFTSMKKLFTVLLAIAIFCPALSFAGMIPWLGGNQLSWGDFQGADPHNGYAATTRYTIVYKYNWDDAGKLTFSVSCIFDKGLSWKQAHDLTPDLLRHEQLHFDVAEIYARKIRQAFARYTALHKYSAATDTDLKRIFDGLMAECCRFNDLYDTDTDHSKIKNKQDEWDRKITGILHSFDSYAIK